MSDPNRSISGLEAIQSLSGVIDFPERTRSVSINLHCDEIATVTIERILSVDESLKVFSVLQDYALVPVGDPVESDA